MGESYRKYYRAFMVNLTSTLIVTLMQKLLVLALSEMVGSILWKKKSLGFVNQFLDSISKPKPEA